MDRFSLSLLVAMAAVLVAGLGVIFFSRHHEPAEVLDPAVTAASAATPAPKSPLQTVFGESNVPAAAPLPVATPAILTQAPPLVAMPTPVPWSPVPHGKLVTIGYPGFTVVYSETLGNPVAVQYAMVNGAKPKRYPSPPSVKTPRGQLLDASGYRRGEMALNSSISLYFGKSSGRNTTLMPNICGFYPSCLEGPWSQFGDMEKRYAGEYGWIEVVAGPIFATPPARTSNGLIVPDAFYRAYRRAYGDTMAFIIPQTGTSTTLTPYLTSISTIEAATGMAIFPNTITAEERGAVAKDVW